MPYKGIVKGNVVVIKKPIVLKDGTEVEIIPVEQKENIDNICGTWQDDRTAEEIIKDIRSSRFSRGKEINL